MKKLYFLFILLISSSVSFGQVVYVDELFNYADGNLVGTGGWASHSGAGSVPVQISSNQIILSHAPGAREDVNISFAEVASGMIYASFNIQVTDDAVIAPSDFEYFAHFNSSSFRSRIDIVAPSGVAAGDDFSVGIASTSSTAEVTWGSDLTFNTTYKISVRYNLSNGQSTLWVDAASEASTSISTATGTVASINGFAFRQSDSTSDETITIDNLVVSNDFDRTLSVEQQRNEITNFSTYPNPVTNGEFFINSASNTAKEVQIFDMLGKQVYAKNVTANERVNVANLNTGIYILKVVEEGKTATRKLVIK
jgi:hypothetical protein